MLKMKILQGDSTTPFLKELQASLKPGSKESLKLRKGMAINAEKLTRDHIIKAAKTRHKTADRLSATRTGYLSKKSDTVESHVTGNSDGLIKLAVYGEIFARVDRDVPIVPRTKKWLTIPWHKEAYGRRAGELGDLTFVKVKPDLAALLKLPVVDGKKVFPKTPGEWQNAIRYWLKKGVTLPRDRGLLPEEDEYAKALEEAAENYLSELQRRYESSFTAGGRTSPA